MDHTRTDWLKTALLALAATCLGAGLVLRLLGNGELASAVWTAGVVPVLIALCAEIVLSLRRGDVGLDVVAALSMGDSSPRLSARRVAA